MLKYLSIHPVFPIPNFNILDRKVLGFMPSIAAAPLGPEITPVVAVRVRSMCSRSIASRVCKPADDLPGWLAVHKYLHNFT
jgi:hypothetical protein